MAGMDRNYYHDAQGEHYLNPSSEKANEAAEIERRATEIERHTAEFERPPIDTNSLPPGYSGISTPSIERYISVHADFNDRHPDNATEVAFEAKPSRARKCMIFWGIVAVCMVGIGIGAGVYFVLKKFENPVGITTTMPTMSSRPPTPAISEKTTVKIAKAIVQECHGRWEANLYGWSGRVQVLSYGHNASCTWIIEVPDGKIALFTLESSNTHASKDSNDMIYFSSRENPLRLYIRGRNTVVFKYTFGVSNIVIQLVTDDMHLATGFTGYWTAENYEDILCKGRKNMTGLSGEINTNPGASYYVDNMHCEWLITVPEKHRVSLEMLNIDLGTNDPISIFDAASPSDEPLFHSSEKRSSSVIVPLGRSLFIVFSSNDYGVGRGFRARYTAIPVE